MNRQLSGRISDNQFSRNRFLTPADSKVRNRSALIDKAEATCRMSNDLEPMMIIFLYLVALDNTYFLTNIQRKKIETLV